MTRPRSWCRARQVVLVALVLVPALRQLTPAAFPAPQGPTALQAEALLDELETVWAAHEPSAWLALWDFGSDEERRREEDVVRRLFAEEDSRLSFLWRPKATEAVRRLSADVQVFVVTEPLARVEYWRIRLEPRGERWAIVARETTSEVDGLTHLSLDPAGRRARGQVLRLEDFSLTMEEGTVFVTPEALGPTGAVFVGRGRVRYAPRPPAEADQLRQYSGAPELDLPVSWAFLRLHPAYYAAALDRPLLEADPGAASRWPEAERIWRERSERAFVLDAALPRSPWWLIPSPGDALIDFPWETGSLLWRKKRTLTLAISRAEPEDVNLFDRDRRLEICSYPSGGRSTRGARETDGPIDILHHDLSVRFEPQQARLSGVATLRLMLRAPVATLRLRLDDDLVVLSITSPGGGALPFFRVRDQDSLVVSLGSLAQVDRAMAVTIRYAGRHHPAPIDDELVQVNAQAVNLAEGPYVDSPPLVYSNRTAWHPRPRGEDFATSRVRLDTPRDYLAVSGGELVSIREEEGRVRAEFRQQQPGKFITAAVARFQDVGLRQEGELALRGFAVPRTKSETQERLRTAEAILGFYTERFGPSPYPFLNVALAEANTPGGHSPPGMVLLQQRPPLARTRSLPDDPASFPDQPDFFLAHELAHQWWGQGTAPASYRERWLSEAWAQYASALWVRQQQGGRAFLDMMEQMRRWALRHSADGPIHLGRRLGVVRGDPRIFRAVVYDKGAWVLQMLRELLGDEAFFAGARAFLERHRYAIATTDELREALESTSGRDLRPYFEQWIYDTQVPDILWSRRTERAGAGHRTTVEARPRGLAGPLPLTLAVATASGRQSRRVTLPPEGGSWVVETAEPPRGVVLNEDGTILARLREVPGIPPAQR
jgi:hypothetical protein